MLCTMCTFYSYFDRLMGVKQIVKTETKCRVNLKDGSNFIAYLGDTHIANMKDLAIVKSIDINID